MSTVLNEGEDEQAKCSKVALLMELLEASAKVERRLDRSLSVIRGLSFSEYRLLRALDAQYASTATRVDLAEAVGLTASAVTRALKPLEKLCYVETQKSERDARQSLAILTPSGKELLTDAQGIVKDVVNTLPVGQLSEQQIRAFTQGLH